MVCKVKGIHMKNCSDTKTLLITTGELSEILRVSKRTIARLKSTGRIPQPLYIGGSARWLFSDIIEFIQNRAMCEPIKKANQNKGKQND
jgi:predicted DNA-binding transcriptional regulator AlpA